MLGRRTERYGRDELVSFGYSQYRRSFIRVMNAPVFTPIGLSELDAYGKEELPDDILSSPHILVEHNSETVSLVLVSS